MKVKCLILGEANVGKTSLLMRFIDNVFKPLTPTLGVDYKQKELIIDKKSVIVQIWDTAGQEKFRTLTKVYFQKIDSVFFVYDITNIESFKNMEFWIKCLKENVDYSKVVTMLIGNKIDL